MAKKDIQRMPLFICRPHEFKLLRDNLTDKNSYSKTYTDYLKDCSDFVKAAIVASDKNVVMRGTWDVPDFLRYCEERKLKPRKQSRLEYFNFAARRAVSGQLPDCEPSFTDFIDPEGYDFLRKCCYPECKKLESKSGEWALCVRCKCNCYCSKECQKQDWKAHKKWCAEVK
eukprot:gb/GEZN01020936.1/.p1 GENE.gb/GEZN01020936.1/~~gb/GEZN01020936.1/.p1  ORF type:complete len:171 (-),score=10.66 gb/GEZN01020936.1/:132-644(-)